MAMHLLRILFAAALLLICFAQVETSSNASADTVSDLSSDTVSNTWPETWSEMMTPETMTSMATTTVSSKTERESYTYCPPTITGTLPVFGETSTHTLCPTSTTSALPSTAAKVTEKRAVADIEKRETTTHPCPATITVTKTSFVEPSSTKATTPHSVGSGTASRHSDSTARLTRTRNETVLIALGTAGSSTTTIYEPSILARGSPSASIPFSGSSQTRDCPAAITVTTTAFRTHPKTPSTESSSGSTRSTSYIGTSHIGIDTTKKATFSSSKASMASVGHSGSPSQSHHNTSSTKSSSSSTSSSLHIGTSHIRTGTTNRVSSSGSKASVASAGHSGSQSHSKTSSTESSLGSTSSTSHLGALHTGTGTTKRASSSGSKASVASVGHSGSQSHTNNATGHSSSRSRTTSVIKTGSVGSGSGKNSTIVHGTHPESALTAHHLSSGTAISSAHYGSHNKSSTARPASTSKASGPSATTPHHTSRPGSPSGSGATGTGFPTVTTSRSGMEAVIGNSTISLTAGEATKINGTLFSIGLDSSVFVNGLPMISRSSAGTPLPLSMLAFQTTSTFIPTASTSKWNSEMRKKSCSPPCTLKMPPLTLKHAETVQFWNITTSFCKVVDSVSYVSDTTIKPPALTLHEMAFEPIKLPKTIKPRAIIVPYYATSVTTEPPFTIGVAPGATACPTPNHKVGTNGQCGSSANQRCPAMQCCGVGNKCGTDSAHCFGGCQHEYGSCWKNSDAGFLDTTDVFANPIPITTALVFPPDQGRGVKFASWAFCWDCDENEIIFAGAGGANGFLGLKFGWGFGGGGCWWLICPHINLGCDFGDCSGGGGRSGGGGGGGGGNPPDPNSPGPKPKNPKTSKPSSKNPHSSSTSSKCKMETATDFTYSCYRQNSTISGSSTITAWSTCTETVSKVVSGCSVEATTTAIYEEGPSCPLGVDVSADDDQGEDGSPSSSCPYIGTITMSIDDDQGEDGSIPCQAQGNVTVTDVVSLCVQMNNTANTPTATSCFNSTTFRVTGTCLTNTTSTSIVPACPYKANISLEPVMLSTTFASMTAAPSLITYGYSAPGNVLDCGATLRRRLGRDDTVAPVYCEWKPPVRNATMITSFAGEGSLAITDEELGFVMSVLADRVRRYSTVDALLSRLKNVLSLDAYLSSMLAEEADMLALVTSMSKKIAPQATQSDTALRSEISWLFVAIASLEKAEKALERTAQGISIPVIAITTSSSIPSANLAAWIASISRAAESLESAIEAAETNLTAGSKTSTASHSSPSAALSNDLTIPLPHITQPAVSSTCVGQCTAPKPTDLSISYCELEQFTTTGKESARCRCVPIGQTQFEAAPGVTSYIYQPIYTVCGYPVCPLQKDWCAPTTGGNLSPPQIQSVNSRTTILDCTFSYWGDSQQHSSCVCNVLGTTALATIPFATTLSSNGALNTTVQVCPNQIAYVTGLSGKTGTLGITTSWWAGQAKPPSATCFYTTPTTDAYSHCTREFDQNGYPSVCACLRGNGNPIKTSAIVTCGQWVCANQVQALNVGACSFYTPSTSAYGKCTQLDVSLSRRSCACEGQGSKEILPTAVCGKIVCFNEATCLPPYSAGLGQCTQTGWWTSHAHAKTYEQTASCVCEGQGTKSVTTTTACGGITYCPNEVHAGRMVDNSGVGWAATSPPPSIVSSGTYSSPDTCRIATATGIGNCVLQWVQDVSATSPTPSCNCQSISNLGGSSYPMPQVTTVCGTVTCPNMIAVQTMIAPKPSCSVTSYPQTSIYGSCTLHSVFAGTSQSAVCSCSTVDGIDYGTTPLNPAPILTCGRFICPNELQNVVPRNEQADHAAKVSADMVLSNDAAFEAARRGLKDYHVQTITTPATPGSTPQPMPRDTSTPPEPTMATEVDGWAIALNQGRQQTTTGSEQPESTKAGASKVLERLLSFF